MHRYLWLFFGAFATSVCLMPLLMRVARMLGIVDKPTHRKIHENPIPYLGGLGIAAGFVIFPLLDYFALNPNPQSLDLLRLGMLAAPALLLGALGLADDKFQVRARNKMGFQLIVVTLFAWFGGHVEIIQIPGWGLIELNDIGIPLTVFWMLCVINGINLVDGIDGLAGVVTAAIYATIAWFALNLPEPDGVIAALALSALGATLGFLIFNWRPAKIYMGDAGSLASGTLIAALLVVLGNKNFGRFNLPGGSAEEPFNYHFAIITLIAFYPLMEIGLSVFRRLLTGKPIGSADRGHIHHRLLKWGWNAPMVCGTALLLCALASMITISVRLHYHGVASWMLLFSGILFVLLLHFCGFLELFHPRAIKGNRPHFLIANHFISMQRIKLELALHPGEIAALIAQTCVEFGVQRYEIHAPVHASVHAPHGGAGKPLELHWEKPASAHGSLLLYSEDIRTSGELKVFSDKVELPSGSRAAWTFEPHGSEDELDVEYRVLMSDFMRKALGCAEYLAHNRKDQDLPESKGAGSGAPVSSTALRRRSAAVSNKFPEIPHAPVQAADDKRS